jgi:uncharacterized damage-inducible protein DinB
MRRISLYYLGLAVIVLSFGSLSRAQDKPADKPAPDAGPTSGPRAEFLGGISYYEQKYTRLAEAIPAEKYTWRPGEGVRSIGDVYVHISAANYGAARALGTAPPAGVDVKSILAMSVDKAKAVQALKDSFAHLRKAVLALSDGDADKPQKMFGIQTTLRGSFLVITGHFGEHLGQSIAYARVNSIVPPWTEEAQQQQQQQKAAEKPKP